MHRIRTSLSVVAVLALCATPAAAFVNVGDQAPTFQSLNEKLEVIDMAAMVDGTPLVFIYGSAT